MKTTPMLRRVLLSLAFVVTGLFGWLSAAQASIDDFISVYQKIESAAPPGSLPASSADLVAYKSLFTCVEGGKDVIVCIDEFHNTNAGKQASDKADIPEGIWQVVEAYVAWKDGDTWGVVTHLGAAAMCAVLQVLAGGTDLCGLIDDLVNAAKELLDAGKAVAKFLISVGESAVNLIDDAGCAVGLWDCDDEPPPPPPEVSAYNQFFAPKVKDGSALKTREDKNQLAFASLVNTLSSAAKQKFAATAVNKAAGGFTKTVNALWTADIVEKVLPALATKRNAYNNAQNILAAAKDAAAAYASNKADPQQRVIARCNDDFAEFLHFDYWISDPQFHALWQQFGSAPGIGGWCLQTFWYKNKAEFTKYFHDAVAAYCPASGQQLLCAKLDHYETCLALMGSVGQKGQCVANKQSIGKEVAQQIKNYFASKGSKYDCLITASANTSVPAVLSCTRPTQQYHCDKYYKEHFGPGGLTPLPAKVVDCALATGSNAYKAYKALEDKAWNQIVPKLIDAHPKLKNYPLGKGYDPLVIGVSSELFAELDADAAKYGLDKKIVMSWEPSIDGMETGTLTSNIGPKIKQMAQDTVPVEIFKSKPGGVNPPDPAGKLSPNKMGDAVAIDAGKLAKSPTTQSLGQTQVMSGQAPSGVGPGPGTVPTKPMSGDMPPGFGVQDTKPGPGPMQAAPPITLPASQPDITSNPVIRIGLQEASWGSTVNVDASRARRQNNGICEFAIQHVARNQGKTSGAAFSRQWTNSRVPGRWVMDYPPIPAGGIVERADILTLKPGMNEVHLNLDNKNKVTEQNETNNQFLVRINVSGNCGAGMARQSPDTGSSPGIPPRPGASTR